MGAERSGRREPRRGFRLLRYFTVTGLAAFLIVAMALYFLEQEESRYFRQVQGEQSVFVAELQSAFVRGHEATAREDLLGVHESGHVTLTRVLANALWDSHLAPFVSRAASIPVEHCRAQPAAARAACFREAGKRILALPEFHALDARVAETVQGSAVFKVKVFDLRGITLYSSEHAQVGEDKHDNRGWELAVGGEAASELTRRDTFSAFEGRMENRDLISSYVPMVAPGHADSVAGVFEIYSDVTPLLERIALGTARLSDQSLENQERLARVAAANQQRVESSAYVLLAIILGLLALLYGVLLLIVLRAQRLLDAQARAWAQSVARESRWHREKMAALATMAASLAHEIGNPLAVISGIAEAAAARSIAGEAERDGDAQLLLQQTRRIAEKTRQMADFAAGHSERPELVDLNQTVRAICEFLAFDRRFRATQIDFRPAAGLPAPVVIPDRLTEAVMNLLQTCVEDNAGDARAPARIIVETLQRDTSAVIRVACEPRPDPPPGQGDPRLEAIAGRVEGIGARLQSSGAVAELILPIATEFAN